MCGPAAGAASSATLAGHKAECAQCGKVLAGSATGPGSAPLALAIAALVLLVPATVSPLMIVSTYGADRESWLPTSASALWDDGFPSLGLLVALFGMALPFAFLALLIWVLGSLYFGSPAAVGTAFRWTKHLRPWVMTEVYLVGGFVSYSRIESGLRGECRDGRLVAGRGRHHAVGRVDAAGRADRLGDVAPADPTWWATAEWPVDRLTICDFLVATSSGGQHCRVAAPGFSAAETGCSSRARRRS